MKNSNIDFHDILTEYNKYIFSKLIKREYDFNILKNKLKQFSLIDNIFNYNDFLTEQEIIDNIQKTQKELLDKMSE